MARILMPLPDRDFDVTEVSVPWAKLTEAGHEVVFATEAGGRAPSADPRLLDGVIFGQLGADPEPVALYHTMTASTVFRRPLSWKALDVSRFDALVLAGGHAPGMRQYLGSVALQRAVAGFWALQRPVGAICHGVLVLARAMDSEGHSVLRDTHTTCLPGYMERLAFYLTAWKLGRYYRTYPAYVETEVRAALDAPASHFHRGPITLGARGSAVDDGPAFAMRDGRYVSARWPGDAYLFARRFAEVLDGV